MNGIKGREKTKACPFVWLSFSRVVIIWAWVSACALSALSQEAISQSRAQNDMRGRVTDVAGNPLQDAHVFIYTGKPKHGPAYLCPSCYLDCGKRVATDADGRFLIKSLAPSLLFRILVVREGYLPQFVPDIDPAEKSVTVALESLDLSDVPPERILQGRVVDEEGEPIVGASVSVEGWGSANGSATWGPSARVMLTPVAVSNLQGQFSLGAKKDLRHVELKILCPNYAQAEFYEIPFGKPSRDFRLAAGGKVTGRLIHAGKPLPGRMISLSSENRGVGSNFTRQSMATDPKGRFTLYSLPAGLVYYVTASMDSIGKLGITPLKTVKDLRNGESRDVGDLVIQPGLTVSGKVQLSDGKPVPQDSTLFLGHEKSWAGHNKTLEPNGEFRFEGLHPGEIRCTLRMPGYRLAKLNRSYNDLNGGELLATLAESVTGLDLLMEPGDRDNNGIGHVPGMPSAESTKFQPLAGIEPLPEFRLAAQVRVRATDAASGEAIESLRVTPGWKFDRNPNPVWQIFQEKTLNASDTMIDIEARSGPAFLRVVAEGYLPASIEVEGEIDEDMTVELHAGEGIRGIVLQPTGHPAPAAQVVMLKPRDDHPGFRSVDLRDGKFGRQTARHHHLIDADQEGRFEFPPSKDVHALFIAHETGFEVVETPELGKAMTVQLRPWAGISGSIPDFNKDTELFVKLSPQRPRLPGDPPKRRPARGFWSGIIRSITGSNKPQPSEQPPLLPSIGLITPNRDGDFNIDHVPPGHWWLVVSHKKMLDDTPHGMFTLKAVATVEVDAEPGALTKALIGAPTQKAVSKE
jgi:uncharacterized GH25 family protein